MPARCTIGDRAVVEPGFALPPERRGIGYLSQEGNLFPHLTVAGNIGFGLPRSERRDRARTAELLELVGLPLALADRRPEQLSGGQQQRVALARALARRPELVLLDEPFGSLDAGLRSSTRRAVADALSAAGATVLLVTHDQDEALSFADQVAIMREGRFVQVGAPREVYSTPVDRATAGVLGELVMLPGHGAGSEVLTALGNLALAGAGATGPVDVAVRPEQVVIGAAVSGAVEAVVDAVDYFGHDALVRLVLPAGPLGPGSVALLPRGGRRRTDTRPARRGQRPGPGAGLPPRRRGARPRDDLRPRRSAATRPARKGRECRRSTGVLIWHGRPSGPGHPHLPGER